MTTHRIVRRARIDGEFTGFDGDMLFKLTDGTYWLQAEYKYWYHYAYRPIVDIIEHSGGLYLGLVGTDRRVRVRQELSVVEAQIDGEFTGWDGKSEYRLTNGQKWKQRNYKYEYKYAYRPRAIVFQSSGGWVMDVEGSRADVAER